MSITKIWRYVTIPSPMSKICLLLFVVVCLLFVVSGMRYDFPKLRYYWVSGNPLRYIPETNIKLAKVLMLEMFF